MINREYESQRNNISATLDFDMLYAAISVEPALLHPPLSALQESYTAGLATVHTTQLDNKNVAIGYSRVIPLLLAEQKTQLNLPDSFPDIYEVGTVFVHPNFRGHGIAEELQRSLMSGLKQRIDRDEVLYIGTTKTRKVLHVMDKLQNIGINFYHSRHTEFPFLAPITCTCNPDFGEGFHHTTSCSKRVTEPEIVYIRKTLPKGRVIAPEIPCTMFVSSESLARRMDTTLEQKYKTQFNWVEALKAINHYSL